jgi:replication factor A2
MQGGGGGAATRNDYNAGGVTNGGMESAYGALPPLQRKIMEVVAGEDSEDGMHVSLVSKQVGNSSGEEVMWVIWLIPQPTLLIASREAIEHLMSEGMLFSTIDDLVGNSYQNKLIVPSAYQSGVRVAREGGFGSCVYDIMPASRCMIM